MACDSLFFDTNAILDFVGSSDLRPRKESVLRLMSACFASDVRMLVSVGSLKDVFFIIRKAGVVPAEAFAAIQSVMRIFEPVDLCEWHAHAALVSGEPDFEDGLIRAQAEDLDVDAIVTDDRAAFAGSLVRHLSARDCLLEFWPEQASA